MLHINNPITFTHPQKNSYASNGYLLTRTMKKGKYNPPSTIEELMKLYYEGSPDEINRYEKFLRNPQHSPRGLNLSEDDIKSFLSKLGEVIKIPENNQLKVPDFIIRDSKLTFEVKSVNLTYEKKLDKDRIAINVKDENEWIEKIDLTLDDIDRKLVSNEISYLGVIWIDVALHELMTIATDMNLIRKTNFHSKRIDGLLVYFQKAGGNVKIKKPILFSKNAQVTDIFNAVYTPSEIDIINC